MRARILLLSLLPLLPLAACGDDDDAASASADDAAPSTTTTTEPAGTKVSWEVALPAGSYGAQVCTGTTCVFPFTSSGKTFTGDLVGTSVGAGGGGAHAGGGLSGGEYSIFVGEVTGCGKGSFSYVDIASGAAPSRLEGTWTIIKGSGTGDLTGITGNGTSVTTTNAATQTGTATATGTIDCG